MTRWTMTASMLGMGLVAGCGSVGKSLPSDELVEQAKAVVTLAVDLGGRARTALELLGILPTYDCGQPRRSFVGEVAAGFEAEFACATVATEQLDAARDAIRLTFSPDGCQVNGTSLSGLAVFAYNGGEDRLDLEADLSALQVAGDPLEMRAGYGTCGDQQSVWAAGQGELGAEHAFSALLSVGLREGIPIFGSSTLVLSGAAELTGPAGTDEVDFDELVYEPGSLLPEEGRLTIQTASGHTLIARFSSGLLLDQVEITIDDHDPVTVPLL